MNATGVAYRKFDSEVAVRPDDIDMNNHVHTSRYLDYVLYARFDQMDRCYGMPMEKFTENGWGWYVKSCQIEYKRPLMMGENIVVRTWLDSFGMSDALVRFQIFRKSTMKIAAEGSIVNTMISTASGRAIPIPPWVITQYTQFTEQESP
jgi:acyl-CoA thioester hydrolase/thioesterase-3